MHDRYHYEGELLRAIDEVPIPDIGPRDVRALREGLNVSQMVFARMVGASAGLVRAWEQGARVPSPMARRPRW